MNVLSNFISRETNGHQCVVELGCMFFDKLALVHPSVEIKVGIEIWEPYVTSAKFKDCIRILGDIREFEKYIGPPYWDCAMLIDSIEHLEKEDGLDLLSRLQKKFQKIVLMAPEGVHVQEKDPTGYGAHESQSHKSTWTLPEFEKLGFEGIVIQNYHSSRPGISRHALFATWERMKP